MLRLMPGKNGGRQDSQGITKTLGTIGSRIHSGFGGLMFTGIPVIFVVAGFWMTFSGVYKAVTYLPVPAVVDKVEGTEETADTVSVTYSYLVDQRQYAGSDSANEDNKSKFQSLRQYKAGQHLTVYRDPGDPSKSELSITPDASFGLAFVTFALPFLALGVNMLWQSLTGKELVKSKAISERNNHIPGGSMFLVFLATCVVGTAAQLALGSVLPWQWALPIGLLILFGAIPATNIAVYKLISRSRARRTAAAGLVADARQQDTELSDDTLNQRQASQAGTANVDDSSGQISGLGKQMAIAIGVTLFWCGITSVFCYFALGTIIKHNYAKLRFASTEGTILASKVKSHSGSDDTTYSLQIKYNYAVGDKQYVGDRYDFASGFSSSDSSYAYKAINQNPAGRKVKVYYNPADPSEAILSLDVPGVDYFLLLFLQPFILAGLVMIAWCITLPSSHGRVRKFLCEPPVIPWQIPAWGVLQKYAYGCAIQSSANVLAPLCHMVFGYGLACFIATFVVGIGFNGFGNANITAISVAFIAAGAVGLAAAVRKLIMPSGGSCLVIDQRNRRLCVHSQRRDLEAPLSEITSLRLRQVLYPSGTAVNNERIQYLLLEAVLSDNAIMPLHAFKWQGNWQGKTVAVATKAQRELGALAGLQATTTIVTATQDEAPQPTNPIEAVRQIARSIREWRKSENYNDLT